MKAGGCLLHQGSEWRLEGWLGGGGAEEWGQCSEVPRWTQQWPADQGVQVRKQWVTVPFSCHRVTRPLPGLVEVGCVGVAGPLSGTLH